MASIDFSINSTCVCIVSDVGYHWHHFGREKTKYFDLEGDGFTRHLFDKRTKGVDYCQTERLKLEDSSAFCSSIVKVLAENSVSHVAFEGHSFNSKGNSLLELVAYQFLLRTLIKDFLRIPASSMFFYPPITVKAFAGGAKFKKKDMLDRFIDSSDPMLENSRVFHTIRSSFNDIVKGEDVAKPVDDLVDSYWIAKKLQQDV